MLKPEDRKAALKRIEQLKRNPPKVTPEHRRQAAALLKKQEKFEQAKDRDIVRERQALAKDVGSYTYNQLYGAGQLFHGIGEGKKAQCSICEQHESQMHNMKDGRWYCAEHRWFGNLTKEQQERERIC